MQQHAHPSQPTPAGSFPTDPTGLPEATRPQLQELADGDTFHLRIGPVAKQLTGTTVRMLGYNGSIPRPTLKVQQDSEVVVHVTNDGDLEATVHWHGLRLDNKYDGVPHETQTPIPVGGEFTYRIRFPDPGLYWYHPHIREDYTQEMGLYGNILVVPAEEGHWPPAHRDVLLTLDDLLIEDGKIAPFNPVETTYTAMGRFGNVLLVAGEQDCSLTAQAGEVVRLWLTNTANTRVFNVQLPGARMKLVGGDSGRVEHEEFISSVILAPSERAVVDVLFGQPGELELQHRTPFWWLTRLRLMRVNTQSRLGRRLSSRPDFIIGSSRRRLQAAGVRFRPAVAGANGRTVRFTDGSSLDAGNVIWATGYRSDYSWIDVPGVARDGTVAHRRGVTQVPGLYFLGLSWQHTRGSALLGFVHDDAAHLAGLITTKARATQPPAARPATQ